MASTLITPEIRRENFDQRHEQWMDLETQWRSRLEEHDQLRALEINSLEDLKDAVADMLRSYNGKESKDWILRLTPALEHLDYFTSAITSVSQYRPVACLVWGGIQALLESASQYRNMSSEVVDLIVELNNTIPSLERYNGVPGFEYAMQDLFQEFMEYCVQASAYYRRPAVMNIFRNLVTPLLASSPRQMLTETRKRIQGRLRRFRQATLKADQQMQGRIQALIPSGVADQPIDLASAAPNESVDFPINTVTKARTRAFVGRADVLEDIEKVLNRTLNSGSVSANDSSQSSDPRAEQMENYESRKDLSASAIPLSTANESTKVRKGLSEADPPDLKPTLNSPAVCVLHGLGGVGKTQTALAYYYQHRSEYDAVFWIESEQIWTLMESFTRITDKLGLLDTKTTDQDGEKVRNKAIDESLTWLQKTNRRWLLIFDNVEDTDDLERFMPTECRCKGSILITTQVRVNPAWIGNLSLVSIKELTREDGGLCIFKYIGREPINRNEMELACDLAEHVGALPLAMATIGGYIGQSQITVEEYFIDVKKSAELWEAAPRVKGVAHYEKSLATVFEKAFSALKDKGGNEKPAGDLLNILAFLNPDSIPEEMFTHGIENNMLTSIPSIQVLRACYFDLGNRQLIRRETVSNKWHISIHRTVQWNLLVELSKTPEKRWNVFKQAFALVRAILPKPSPLSIPESEMWPPYAKYGKQVFGLRTHCLWPEPSVKLPMDFAQILNDMGMFIWFSGQFNEGEEALETAESIVDDNKAAMGHPLRANIYATLGIILSFDGVSERDRSFEFRRKAYDSRMKGLGQKEKSQRSPEEENLLWIVRSDMAYGWIQQENFEETSRIMEECLREYQKWGTEDEIPFEYTKYYQLKSFCHMADQKPVEANEAITRCLKLMVKAAGEDHSMVQLIKFCYANILWHSGQKLRDEALQLHKAILSHRKKLLGDFSHFTLESYSTCGKLCEEADELENARHYLEACLQRRKRAVWNEEGVARAQFRYARVLHRLASRAKDEGKIAEMNRLKDEATKCESAVSQAVQRFRTEYVKYMPESDDQEAILDQMVSFWAGRFTGKLRQSRLDMPELENMDVSDHSDTEFCDVLNGTQ